MIFLTCLNFSLIHSAQIDLLLYNIIYVLTQLSNLTSFFILAVTFKYNSSVFRGFLQFSHFYQLAQFDTNSDSWQCIELFEA